MPSAELRFVFRSADPSATAAELLALATEVQDWARALRLAEREGATAALWRTLRESANALPAEAAEFLRARTMMSDFRMLQLSQRLAQTVSTFREHGVPVMLLKGAAIGALGDVSFRARPMTDVDLLVRQADAARARAAVLAAGWQQTDDARLHTLLQGMHHEAPFYDARLPGLRLELHTVLLPPDHSFAFTEAELWDAAVSSDAFPGATVPALPHLLFHVAVHFAWQHQMLFGTWRTIRALAVLVQQPTFAWSPALAMARRTKGLTSLHWTLRLAERLAGMRIPAEILRESAPPTAEWVCAAVERSVLAQVAPGEGPTSPSERINRLLWRAAIRPGWSGLRTTGRDDPEHRWARAMGTYQAESLPTRLQRHVRASRDWWAFITRTVAGR